jgi:hypothetical protein
MGRGSAAPNRNVLEENASPECQDDLQRARAGQEFGMRCMSGIQNGYNKSINYTAYSIIF